MPDLSTTPEAIYRQRCADFRARCEVYDRRSRLNGNVNLLLFLAGILFLGGALWRSDPLLYAVASVLLVAFVVAKGIHIRINRVLLRYRTLLALNEEGLHRLVRTWSSLPDPVASHSPNGDDEVGEPKSQVGGTAAIDENTAIDLDLLGHASLEHLLGTPFTPVGRATLRRWLLDLASPPVVRSRQSAVAELAPEIDFRDEVGVRGRLMESDQESYARFIAWAEGDGWLHRQRWLMLAVRLLPLVVLGLLLSMLFGMEVLPILVAVLVVNLALTMTIGRRVMDDIGQVAARQAVYAAYGEMFQFLTDQSFSSPGLRQLQEQLATDGRSASAQMQRLGRLMPLADIRRSILFFPIEIATLWSFHLLWLLEGWQRAAGGSVRLWLKTLGETEALIALATLHFDHPTWAFPELIDKGPALFEAVQLAHPLLQPGQAVANDVTVGPSGTFLLVTGSNMSGKSTLLRAIGLNTVLAQIGAPVCAAQLKLTPLTVASSMRVQDSLEAGISYFMAELRRLKAIVDLADARQGATGISILYLLDEILQGTNTAERQIAARHIVLHLVESGAIGAVSTHDLTLADTPNVAACSVPVYFTEQFTRGSQGPSMHFDYRLRPGIATSTNALKWMELVGLPLTGTSPQDHLTEPT